MLKLCWWEFLNKPTQTTYLEHAANKLLISLANCVSHVINPVIGELVPIPTYMWSAVKETFSCILVHKRQIRQIGEEQICACTVTLSVLCSMCWLWTKLNCMDFLPDCVVLYTCKETASKVIATKMLNFNHISSPVFMQQCVVTLHPVRKGSWQVIQRPFSSSVLNC